MKNSDYAGWKTGQVPPVSICLRKGDVGVDNPKGESSFPRRSELEWPIARTEYTKLLLAPWLSLETNSDVFRGSQVSCASGDSPGSKSLRFAMHPVDSPIEVTGHVLAHLAVSFDSAVSPPLSDLDIDLFLTLRHFSASGKEILYTGSSGDAVPLTRGWIRVSMRKVNENSPYHRSYVPRRECRSSDVQPVQNGAVYDCDVELWPTNIIVEKGGWLVLEIASEDTEGSALFKHNSAIDR
jgi:hypothetical protein